MPAEMQKQRRYLSIQDGKMIERHGEFEMRYSVLKDVWLTDISFQKVKKNGQEIGELLLLHLIDNADYWVLKMWVNDSYARAFGQMMQHINWEFPLAFATSMKIEAGKKKHSLFMSQNGFPLKWCYTKGNMQDCPPIEWIEQSDGSIKADDSLQQMFFIIKIENWLIPLLRSHTDRNSNHPCNFSNSISANNKQADSGEMCSSPF